MVAYRDLRHTQRPRSRAKTALASNRVQGFKLT